MASHLNDIAKDHPQRLLEWLHEFLPGAPVALRGEAALAIDCAVHHVEADGSRRPKVFKGWQIELPPREQTTLVKHHSLRAVTTRHYHGGEHLPAVQIDGRTVAEASFTLVMPKTAGPG